MADDEKQEEQQTDPGPDPVVDGSLSWHILIASGLLFLSLVWALYDELIAERPWKAYQQQFVQLYARHLRGLGARQVAKEKTVRASAEFQAIEAKLQAADAEAAPAVAEIDTELQGLRARLAVVSVPFQDVRARVAAMTYELDHAGGESSKNSIREDIRELKAGPFQVDWPDADAAELNFEQMEQEFNRMKSREAVLNAERARLTEPVRLLRNERNQYVSDNLAGLNEQQVRGLLRGLATYEYNIKQIHIEEGGFIDRCESCHLGIREPLTLTEQDMRGRRVFVSHPRKELLDIHDPNRFGCSPCHNGNGLATSSTTKAHGQYKHWLWTLFPKENAEAGCLQCHLHDRDLEHAEVLNRGRDLYQIRGCMGCHRHESYDREMDALTAVQKQIQTLAGQQREFRLEVDREIAKGDGANSNDEAQAHYDQAENLRVTVSNMDAEIEVLDMRSKHLMQDRKMIGPNLKEARLKLSKDWLPVWLADPPAFRPGTKMPKFRLTDEEVRALSAFVWQSGWDGPPLQPQDTGNADNGKELFETRGCLACHSIGEGENRMGGDFAANLSRLGEKANYDFIVRWIENPRHRTRPYCPHEGRDLTPEDYTSKGLPYEYGLENSKCPNDGHELQVQNMTVMPSLRLSRGEARDIATYLMGLRQAGATYPGDTGFMDDPDLAERGRVLTSRYGCGSCHEIQGLEDAPRIGTELTFEASKPMEQLDFGLHEHQAKKEGWYTHKAFFQRKLQNPAFFDEGREKSPEELLRMPNIELSDDDVEALTTFLLGSMDSPFHGEFRAIPEQFRYVATDRQRDIQEGWWLIKKYNCVGCHVVKVGQESVLSSVPRYQDADWVEQLPPSLIQEGARVNPDWLAQFLANPAMSERDTDRNGLRGYLHARMPSFNLSPSEVRTLVRFFEAMAGQDSPHISERLEPLTDTERQLARTLFSSNAAPCLKCHLVGDPRRDQFASAPNFLIAKERLKPGWTARWLLDPQAISPGTAMPSGLFQHDGQRWTFSGPTPPSFQNYTGDHVDLLVRYMFELTAAEQQRLLQRMPVTASAPSSAAGAAMMAANTQD